MACEVGQEEDASLQHGDEMHALFAIVGADLGGDGANPAPQAPCGDEHLVGVRMEQHGIEFRGGGPIPSYLFHCNKYGPSEPIDTRRIERLH
ncbi:MAG: hypothetical protein AMXMBFR61_16850 [Fimbriimonadales bacterium]